MMKEIRAVMAGTVLRVNVKPGDPIHTGDEVVVLESMKMEVPQTAEGEGVVTEVLVQIGDFVNEGDLLVTLQ